MFAILFERSALVAPTIGLRGAGSAEVLQLPVSCSPKTMARCILCPHANNKSAAVSSAHRPKKPAGAGTLWATCHTVGRATPASHAEFP